MTQTLAVDYSFSRPDPHLIASKGYQAVGRYLSFTAAKNISRAEAAAIHAAGLKIWLVWETVANRAAAGYTAGQADAHAAVKQADAVGLPVECPLFFAVDFDANPDQVRAYFQGVVSVLPKRAGVYGGIRVTEGLRGLVPWRWQTAAWSGGRVDPEAHIYQRVQMTHPIGGCDENVLCHPFPLWGGQSPHPKPHPQPKPQPQPAPHEPTRLENFHAAADKGMVDVRVLDRAIASGRHGITAERDQIVAACESLRGVKHEPKTLIGEFLAVWDSKRTAELPLLQAAMRRGRTGAVRHAVEQITAAIHALPKS